MSSLAAAVRAEPARPARDPVQTLRRRRNLFGGLALLFLAIIVGTAVLDEVTSVSEDSTFVVGPSPRLVIRDHVGGGLRGGIDVRAAAGERIHVEGEVHGTWRVRYAVEQLADGVGITVEPRPFLGWLSLLGPARFTITTPPGTRLDVESSSAPIEVHGVAGGGALRTTNGGMHLVDVRGALSAETVNGGIGAAGLDGPVELHTVNGSIVVERSRGSFVAKTTNGSITLDAELDQGRHSLETTNGAVTVRLRGEPSLRVGARTTNGAVVTGRPMSAAKHRPNELSGTIGGGAGELSIRTTNGAITID